MKHITAIIRPEKLDDVRQALEKVGYSGLMISEIEGHGNKKESSSSGVVRNIKSI